MSSQSSPRHSRYFLGVPPAYADHCGPGQTETPVQGGLGHVCVVVTVPGIPGHGDGPEDDPGGGGTTTCQRDGEVIPCSDGYGGTWNSTHNCYAYQLDPQPPAGDPRWEGHDPSEGSVWGCDYSLAVPGNTFFVPDGAAPLADPAVLAQRAVGQMRLERANAQIAPSPAFHTYVHIENWMWVPVDQWHNLHVTVSAGPTSVTATAEPIRVEWDMGTETVSCYDAGRAWVKGMTDAAKTTCSYAYESIENPTGDLHEVSAQIVYGVTWTCSGACLSPSGDLGELSALAGAPTTIEVRQRQTVVTN